ncbi:hypothetical protein F5Y09DRAFT_341014 [Xylaria sp. FL1042]|nr:hypothetical protein F5Y09DRAFT_341014 [Xylaria sp. FL1042]
MPRRNQRSPRYSGYRRSPTPPLPIPFPPYDESTTLEPQETTKPHAICTDPHITGFPPLLPPPNVESPEDAARSPVAVFPTGDAFFVYYRQQEQNAQESTSQTHRRSPLNPRAPPFFPGVPYDNPLFSPNSSESGRQTPMKLEESASQVPDEPEIQTPDVAPSEGNNYQLDYIIKKINGQVPFYKLYFFEWMGRGRREEYDETTFETLFSRPIVLSHSHRSDLPPWPLTSFAPPAPGEFYIQLYSPSAPVLAIHSLFTANEGGQEIEEGPAIRILTDLTGTQLDGFLFVDDDRFTLCGLSDRRMTSLPGSFYELLDSERASSV